MNRRVRRVLFWSVFVVAVTAAVSLWMLRSGRPLYYTDGEQQYSARELSDASMLIWDPPLPEYELPGPVVGRVAAMPDGRLLYGRGSSAERTDLVLFDPARPNAVPERAVGLNSRGHDLAPVLLADGWLYFSSDRRGGVGGFDLYRARLRGGAFGAVEALPDWINTGLDEADPAPAPDGTTLVFTRRDPGLRDGANSTLMLASLSDATAAVPLYEPDPERVDQDRDPAWSPDGVCLWFVRQTDGGPLLLRTWRLEGTFAPPHAPAALRAGGPFRGPAPDESGFGLRLLKPAADDSALTYFATARELYPWWAGQAWLELLLLIVLLIALLLLLLLWLGERWRQLDVITWCLLLSLFLHFLAMLWLADVQIVRRFFAPDRDDGGLQVELLADAGAAAGGGLEIRQAQRQLHREARFAEQAEALSAAAPAAVVAATEPQPTATPATTANQELTAPAVETAASALADAASEEPRHDGRDESAALAARAQRAEQSAHEVQVARAQAAAQPLAAAQPSATPEAGPSAARAPDGAAPSALLETPTETAVAQSQVSDTPTSAPLRTGTDGPAAAAAAVDPGALAASSDAVQPAPRTLPGPRALAAQHRDAQGLARATDTGEAPPSTHVANLPSAPTAAAAPMEDAPREAARHAGSDAATPLVAGSSPAPAQQSALPRAERAAAQTGLQSAGRTGAAAPQTALAGGAPRARPKPEGPAPSDAVPVAAAPAQPTALADAPQAQTASRSADDRGRGAALAAAPTTVGPRASALPRVNRPATADPGGAAPAATATPRPTDDLARAGAPRAAAGPQSTPHAPDARRTALVAAAPELADELPGASTRPAAEDSTSPALRAAVTALEPRGQPLSRPPAPRSTAGAAAAAQPATPPSSLLAAGSGRRGAEAPAAAHHATPMATATGAAPATELRDAPRPETASTAQGDREQRDASRADAPASTGPVALEELGPRRGAASLAAPIRDGAGAAAPDAADIAAPPASSLARADRTRRPGARAPARRDAAPSGAPAAAVPSLRDGLDRLASGLGEQTPREGRADARGLNPVALQVERGRESRREPGRAMRRNVTAARGRAGGVRPPGSLLAAAPRQTHTTAPRTVAAELPSVFDNRFGVKKTEALERFGGTTETERAVQRGLAYLARIQRADGGWGRRVPDEKYGDVTIGKTGLCLLAFLGAGHLPSGDTRYAAVAARAVEYLVRRQDARTGAIGRTSSYGHGIASYALAECHALDPDLGLEPVVVEAMRWILANQNHGRDPRSRGGWGYFSTVLSPEDSFARTSVSVWMVMALESAKISGIRVPEDAMRSSDAYLRNQWSSRRGYFFYNQNPRRLSTDWPTLPASTPAAAFALLLRGASPTERTLRGALQYIVQRRPRVYERPTNDDFVHRAAGNVYFWYYGSLACLLAGGDAWERWNAALKVILPEAQRDDGSWQPIDPYAEMAQDTDRDAAYTTAMCVLSLEVYYRYFTPLLQRG